jgi:hypothetical protein
MEAVAERSRWDVALSKEQARQRLEDVAAAMGPSSTVQRTMHRREAYCSRLNGRRMREAHASPMSSAAAGPARRRQVGSATASNPTIVGHLMASRYGHRS